MTSTRNPTQIQRPTRKQRKTDREISRRETLVNLIRRHHGADYTEIHNAVHHSRGWINERLAVEMLAGRAYYSLGRYYGTDPDTARANTLKSLLRRAEGVTRDELMAAGYDKPGAYYLLEALVSLGAVRRTGRAPHRYHAN
jgi:hypothetical protein